MKKNILSLIGFALFIVGAISLILMLIGLKLSFLSFIDANGRTLGLVIRLTFIIMGLIITYVVRTSQEEPQEA